MLPIHNNNSALALQTERCKAALAGFRDLPRTDNADAGVHGVCLVEFKGTELILMREIMHQALLSVFEWFATKHRADSPAIIEELIDIIIARNFWTLGDVKIFVHSVKAGGALGGGQWTAYPPCYNRIDGATIIEFVKIYDGAKAAALEKAHKYTVGNESINHAGIDNLWKLLCKS